MTWPCLLRVDESVPRLKSLRHRDLLVTRCSTPEQAWAALVLSSPSLSQLSTPSPARDVLPMCVCVSVRLRGAQPSGTGAARSSTCIYFLQAETA
jgi:hypothetical protein